MIRGKTKGRFLLRIYISILVFLISFFTIYAFRNSVLDLLAKSNTITFQISEKEINNINNELKNIDAQWSDISLVNDIIRNQFQDYDFVIFTRGGIIGSNEIVVVDQEQFKDDKTSYFFTSSGGLITKQSAKYSDSINISFRNIEGEIALYPKFNKYLSIYRIVDFILSFLLCSCVYLFMRYEAKYNKIRNKLKKVNHHRAFKNLSVNIVVVNLLAGALAISCFLFMYQNRFSFFEFVNDFAFYEADYTDFGKKMQSELNGFSLDKKNKGKIIEVLNKHAGDTYDLFIFDEKQIYYAGQSISSVPDQFYKGGNYDVSVVSSPRLHMILLQFTDQTATLNIYAYPLVKLVTPYIVTIACLSISLWLIILLCFIQRKVFEIKMMQEDVSVLSTGDWSREVRIYGYDEIAELANHLNQMRISFLENAKSEEHARSANKELITSLSHDLRTPLTSLLGYLDIIRLKKYKSQEQYESYLNLCVDKVNQINDLSNKTFEYAMVFESNEDFSTQKVATSEIETYLINNIQFLRIEGFNIDLNITSSDIDVDVNMAMIKRIFNNLISNLFKYADRNQKIIITMGIEKEQLAISFSNEKIQNRDIVESNSIGLKSVTRMIELHQGEIYVSDDEDSFMVVITIPIVNR